MLLVIGSNNRCARMLKALSRPSGPERQKDMEKARTKDNDTAAA